MKIISFIFVFILQGCAQERSTATDALAEKPLSNVDNISTASSLDFASICKNAIFADPAPLISVSSNEALERSGSAVKVLSYMSRNIFDSFWQNITATASNRYTWVTLAPEVQTFCQNFVLSEAKTLEGQDCKLKVTKRLDQFLGLTPNESSDKVLVSFFVDQSKLIRPCYNPDINSYACLKLPAQNLISSQINMSDFITAKYGENLSATCYPFTARGYTYDWGGPESQNVGANEFIIPGITPISEIKKLEIDQLCGC